MAENTELMTVDNICNRVYVIRGQQVMLDYDLAELYGYEVKALNQQVKRNIDRFPEDFMFQLKKEEMPKEFSKSQIVTLNEKGDKRGTNIKKMPYAFTEQGIYMLATVLKGKLAEQQSIFIMRAFREMRHYIKQNQQFVTQSEMHLVSVRVSEISVQMSNMADRQKKTEQDIQVIQKSMRHIKRAVENGATSVLEPELEPWGQRTCYIADPEGNLIEIGSWNKPYEEKNLEGV